MCPRCGESPTRVTDTRERTDGREVRRRRKCVCGYRWTTYEIYGALLKRKKVTPEKEHA